MTRVYRKAQLAVWRGNPIEYRWHRNSACGMWYIISRDVRELRARKSGWRWGKTDRLRRRMRRDGRANQTDSHAPWISSLKSWRRDISEIQEKEPETLFSRDTRESSKLNVFFATLDPRSSILDRWSGARYHQQYHEEVSNFVIAQGKAC